MRRSGRASRRASRAGCRPATCRGCRCCLFSCWAPRSASASRCWRTRTPGASVSRFSTVASSCVVRQHPVDLALLPRPTAANDVYLSPSEADQCCAHAGMTCSSRRMTPHQGPAQARAACTAPSATHSSKPSHGASGHGRCAPFHLCSSSQLRLAHFQLAPQPEVKHDLSHNPLSASNLRCAVPAGGPAPDAGPAACRAGA